MEFKMTEASIDDALKVLKENTEPFDLMAELENRMREFTESNLLFERKETPYAPGEYSKKTRAATPVAKITEAWGKIGPDDRSIIEQFTKNLGGEANTVKKKIELIAGVINPEEGETKAATLGEIMTVMMVVQIMSSILDEFTEAAGGFIFEGFLAGLFGGQSVQITEPSDLAGRPEGRVEVDPAANSAVAGKPITDVVLGDKHYSLKLLGKKTAVKGSFSNMIQHFMDYNHVIYLDARREGSTLHFSEFDITLENFLDVFFKPWAKQKPKEKKYTSASQFKKNLESLGPQVRRVKFGSKPLLSKALGPQLGVTTSKIQFELRDSDGDPIESTHALLSLDAKLLQPYGPFTIYYFEEAFGGAKLKKLFGSASNYNKILNNLKKFNNTDPTAKPEDTLSREEMIASLMALPGAGRAEGSTPEQFVFTAEQVKEISSYRDLGVLELGEPAMKKIWLQHGELLNATMAPVYETLNRFTDNVNEYFLANDKSRGNQAVNDAKDLDTATSNAVKGLGAEPAQMTKQQIAQMNRRTKAHAAQYGESLDRDLLITNEALGINRKNN